MPNLFALADARVAKTNEDHAVRIAMDIVEDLGRMAPLPITVKIIGDFFDRFEARRRIVQKSGTKNK